MNFVKYEEEISKYVVDLYGDVKDELKECFIPEQVDQVFEKEKIRVTDFMKYLERSIKIELAKSGESSLANIESINEEKYFIPERDIDSNKIFNFLPQQKEKQKEVAVEKQKDPNFNKRATMIGACAVITFIIGFIIRQSVVDALMTAAVGVLAGVGANDILYADRKSDFNNLLNYQKAANKRINDEYIDESIQKRKNQIENTLINFLNNYRKL